MREIDHLDFQSQEIFCRVTSTLGPDLEELPGVEFPEDIDKNEFQVRIMDSAGNLAIVSTTELKLSVFNNLQTSWRNQNYHSNRRNS